MAVDDSVHAAGPVLSSPFAGYRATHGVASESIHLERAGGAMLINAIRAAVLDRTEIHEAVDRWVGDLASTADGWRSTTSGVTADDMFLMVTVFDSQAAAREINERPEQHHWWMETSKLFAGEVILHDCPVADVIGACDEAAFVRIVEGRVPDSALLGRDSDQSSPASRPVRMAVGRHVIQLMLRDAWPTLLPHFLGGLAGYDPGDGTLTEVGYYTSEQAAREEAWERPPPDHASLWQEWQSLLPERRWYDLTEPWHYSSTSGACG